MLQEVGRVAQKDTWSRLLSPMPISDDRPRVFQSAMSGRHRGACPRTVKQ
ncbi:hypothetical protein APTSU1_000469000 [Apodemus speciosus]|uniref:Uncharacterized protein n=1 Tax=Apodemus speciosus TaxID=105296 RepID=A0ABQ0ERG0_APOSI